jgi:membrane-associated phospholipid phosphatase
MDAPQTVPGAGSAARSGTTLLASYVATATALSIFVLLGHEAGLGRISGWDLHVRRLLHGHDWRPHPSSVDHVANLILDLSGNVSILVLGFAFVLILLAKRRLRDALFVVITVAAVAALTPLFKVAFERPDSKYSFPSGHASLSAAFAFVLVLLTWSTRWRWPALGFGALFAALLGEALVYENWHLPSDVLGGWCLAVACGAMASALFRMRRFDRAVS